MDRKQSRASGAVTSQAADDFKSIKGIGPAFARRLHAAGIRTYAQLASLSPAKIAALVAGPSAEQIAKQDWVGQARKLALRQKPGKRRTSEPILPGGLHRVNFRVELVLTEDNAVHHTNVTHIQSGGKDTWAGWQPNRLTDFLVQHAGLRHPPPEPVPPVAMTVEPTISTVITNLTGTLRLRNAEIVAVDAGSPPEAVRVGRPFNVLVTLDLGDVTAPSNATLAFIVYLYAKTLGRGTRQIVAEAHGTLSNSDTITVPVRGTTLTQGLYLLKVIVTLALQSVEPSAAPDLIAVEEIGLLQIY
jgi:hypothetical protein